MQFNSKYREALIKCLINCLKEDHIPWEKPWKINEAFNPVTNHIFSGISNKVILALAAEINHYSDPRWCTLNQTNSKHWKIKKGEHGTLIGFWSWYNRKTKQNISISEANKILKEDKDARDYLQLNAKSYCVFNGDQIDGIPELEVKQPPNHSEEEVLYKTNTLIHGLGVQVHHGGNKSYYHQESDSITLPPISSFHSIDHYCSTLLHEGSHATGHVSRLNRDLTGKFGSESYAREELRAEIASAFLMGELDLTYSTEHMANHAAYIQSWITILEKNPEELFSAFKDAEQIFNYMVELFPEKEILSENIQTDKSLNDRIKKAQHDHEKNNIVKTLEDNTRKEINL